MITNDRQLKISKSLALKFADSIRQFGLENETNIHGSEILAKAQLGALKSELDILKHQISEYELLKSGSVRILSANSLSELPLILIKARIAKGFSQKQLAERLGLKEQQIQRYESEEYASASLRRLSEIASALLLDIKEVAELRAEESDMKVTDENIKEFDWLNFPFREMYRRGWFENFTDSLSSAVENSEYLLKNFVEKVKHNPSLAFYKTHVRSGTELNRYSLFAWECRILALASVRQKVGAFKVGVLDQNWFDKLTKLSQHDDGPLRAQTFLRESGIHLVVEPHLPGTYLDGAAMLYKDNPVVGLTLRYDRLDNFWFVLLHELVHIKKHLRKGALENIFDDLDSSGEGIEVEADNFALEYLIPNSIWETALPRYLRSESSVKSFASQKNIHPAIVAGRIRHEAKNFIILNNLIGQGQVRKFFTDVNFGA